MRGGERGRGRERTALTATLRQVNTTRLKITFFSLQTCKAAKKFATRQTSNRGKNGGDF